MTVTATHTWFRKTVLALAVTLAAGATAAPAFADEWRDRGRHEWREHEWRRHQWQERHAYYYGPTYAYPPGAYVQVPGVGWGSR